MSDLADLLSQLPADRVSEFTATLGDPADVAAVEEALTRVEAERRLGIEAAAEWRATPATMAHHLSRGQFRLWRYVQLLGEKYRDAVEGRSTRQIWNLPARYGKSVLGSRWGSAWLLDRRPSAKLILVSYGDMLAVENAVAVRDILREHHGTLRAELRRDRQQQDRFVTTEGGGVLAAGIMSQITGFGADGVVFDDPFKDWQEAHSAARRDLVDNQYRAVVTLRLETEQAFVIIIMTRWHEDDLTGRLWRRMEDGTGEAWEMVRLPALAEQTDPTSSDPLLRIPDALKRLPGEPLEPERFSLVAVKARHLALGSYLVAGLEQQRPAPEEGGELKRAWWRIDTELPSAFDEMISSWDMKLKSKETGDFVVGQTWGRTSGHFWLAAQLRGQWDQPTTENAIALCAVREPRIRLHVLEASGNAPEVREALAMANRTYEVSEEIAGLLGMTDEERASVRAVRRRGLTNVALQPVKGDKVARMRAQSGQIEAGSVHLWARLPGLEGFLDETAAFPNGGNDDQVDAVSQALKYLRGHGQTRVLVPKGTLPKTPISRTGPSITMPRGYR